MQKTLPIILLLFISACNQQKTKTVSEENTIIIDDHNSKNALDWAGTYKGILPCADCAGIELTLNITDDASYSLKEIYLTEEPNEFISEGKFEWNENGSQITLLDEHGPIIFKVGENYLLKLDVEGKVIEGELASNYVLNKQ